VARASRRPGRLQRADRRVERVAGTVVDQPLFQSFLQRQRDLKRLSSLHCLNDTATHGAPRGRLLAARIALVRLADAELFPSEKARIGLEGYEIDVTFQ